MIREKFGIDSKRSIIVAFTLAKFDDVTLYLVQWHIHHSDFRLVSLSNIIEAEHILSSFANNLSRYYFYHSPCNTNFGTRDTLPLNSLHAEISRISLSRLIFNRLFRITYLCSL